MLVLIACWTAAFTSVYAAQCNPISVFWDEFEIEWGARCIEVQKFYLGVAWSDFILDILVLALPIPAVVMLNMPWKKKVAVIDVFLLGAV